MSNQANQENKSNKEFEQKKDEQDSESGYIEKLPEELNNLNLPPEIKKEIRTFLASRHRLFHQF